MKKQILRVISVGATLMAGYSVLAGALPANTINLTGTIRDFNAPGFTPTSLTPHTDFQDDIQGVETGKVGLNLSGGKPVYAGGETLDDPNTSFNGAAYFNQWYNDAPGINMSDDYTITLTETSPGVYTYSSSSFFPIDGQLGGNQGLNHNFHFTYELHTMFTYLGIDDQQSFGFTGDDDLWVFVNNQKVIDLGGIHGAASSSFDAYDLGLTPGEDYSLEIFFAERHTTESNFKIETGIQLRPEVPEPGEWALMATALTGLVGYGWRRKVLSA